MARFRISEPAQHDLVSILGRVNPGGLPRGVAPVRVRRDSGESRVTHRFDDVDDSAHALRDEPGLCESMPKDGAPEHAIFVATREVFRAEQIVDLETPAFDAAGVRVLDRHEPLLPSVGELRGLGADALRVVAEGLMKRRELAE